MTQEKIILMFVGDGKQTRYYNGEVDCNIQQPQSCRIAVSIEKADQMLTDHPSWFEVVKGEQILTDQLGYEDRQFTSYRTRGTVQTPSENIVPTEAPADATAEEESSEEKAPETNKIEAPAEAPSWSWTLEQMLAWLDAKKVAISTQKKTVAWAKVKEVFASAE